MAQPQDSSTTAAQPRERRPRRGFLPPELVDVMVPSLKTGAVVGGVGTIAGTAAAIVKDAPPGLFGVSTGIQWFTLGTSYWLTRSVVMKVWGGEASLTSGQKTTASAIAGGATGMVGGLMRGPRNILHGAVWFTIFGAAGQACANKVNEWNSTKKSGGTISWLAHKYSPLKKMSDEEYEDFMGEKMIRIEAEMALIDDKIAELRAAAAAKEKGQDNTQRGEKTTDQVTGQQELLNTEQKAA